MPPQAEPASTYHVPEKKEGVGAIVGIIIIVIIMLLGALYFWGTLLNRKDQQDAALPLNSSDSSTSLTQ